MMAEVSTVMSVPVSAVTSDGATSWEYNMYHGIIGYVWTRLDGTFQNYLDNLEVWESGLLECIDMIKTCYDLVELFQDKVKRTLCHLDGKIVAHMEKYICCEGLSFGT
eukprot:12590987-Ditylum_brightwellii.AAC.1